MAELEKLVVGSGTTLPIPIIWVLGGPGAGKSTQCSRLAKKYGLEHICPGELLRDEAKSGSEQGRVISERILKGMYVPSQIVLEVLKKAIIMRQNGSGSSSTRGYLLDGFPREIEKGEAFEKEVAPCSLLLHFDCGDETLKERLLARAESSSSAARVDDTETIILKRFETYHKCSDPVITKYASKVVRISAEGEPESVFFQCCTSIDALLEGERKGHKWTMGKEKKQTL